jgi:ATP-dependent DNA ligase
VPRLYALNEHYGTIPSAMHCAFDLLELDGWDLRSQPIEGRKGMLAKPLCHRYRYA